MSQGQGNPDDGMGPLYVTGAVLLIGIIVKTLWGDAIMSAWLGLRHLWVLAIEAVWPWKLKGLSESLYWMNT